MTANPLGTLYSRLPENPATVGDRVYPHRVPTRDEARALIRVDVFPTNGISIGGQHVKHGVQELVVYKSELPAIEARVAMADHVREWDRAVKTYEAALNRFLDKEIGKPPAVMTEEYRLRRERAAKAFGDTTPSLEFARAYPGGRPPITKLEKLGDVEAPETEGNRERKQMASLVQNLADAILKATKSNSKG